MASGQHRPQLVHALAGQRRDLQHRGVADEVQLAGHLAEHVGPVVGIVEQLPLVEQHDDRAAGGVDALGQTLVLAR